MKWLEGLELPREDRHILGSSLRRLRGLDEEVLVIEARIALKASEDGDVRLLMTLTGVGHFGAMLLVSEIGDVTRFPSGKKLVSWAGLCPTLHQSGETARYGRLKKTGNRHVRWMMVQAAYSASRHDPELRKLYLRTRRRHGHQKAVMRVANKMLRVVWCMLTRGEPYRHGKDRLYEAKLKRMERIARSGLA